MPNIQKSQSDNGLRFVGAVPVQNQIWQGPLASIVFDEAGIHARLRHLDSPCYVLRHQGQIGITNEGKLEEGESVVATNAFEDMFGNHEFVAVLVEADDVFAPDILRLIRELGEDLEANIPLADEILSLTDFEFIRGTLGKPG